MQTTREATSTFTATGNPNSAPGGQPSTSSIFPNVHNPGSTLKVQWRPKERPIFSGKPSEDAHTWVSVVTNYYLFMNGTPQQEVAYAATLLRDAAHDWWQAYLHRQRGRLPHDWATFSTALLDRFGSKLQAKQALANIMTI